MSELKEQLQAALGSAYLIERELGGGGMSRVFVATERALDRQVVVKVLPFEAAAGVSMDRFRREIALAAKLQHPHIVPVLSAGEMDGVPYYTMPLVAGESLRQRLAQHGELSVDETIRILREVADALAHAHEHGVVHRDIKPENILLSKQHALVADFGVAKAIASAGGPVPATASYGSVTSLGVALGTPAYMSPEQATADPATDHRADIYALGCVGYEMLTGYPLFSGRSPQATLAAHSMETPEPLLNRRPSVPPGLAELVMRCLEKRPGDRPQTAAEVERVLATLTTTPSGGSAPTARATAVTTASRGQPRRVAVAAGSVLALAIALTITFFLKAGPPALPVNDNVIAVAPFRVSADPSLAYLREGMLDLLAANLTGEGGPRATDPRASLAAWRQAGGDAGDITEEESRLLARRLGAGRVLLGSIVGSGNNNLVITARVIRTTDGTRSDVRIAGSVDSLTHLVDRLTAEVLSQNSAAGSQLRGTLTTVPLPAIRAWLDGQAAYRRARYHEATDHFNAALRIDSTFVPAAISGVIAWDWVNIGDPPAPELRAGFLHAWDRRTNLSARDRVVVSAAARRFRMLPPGSIVRTSESDVSPLKDSAAISAPDNADVWYMIADALFHFGEPRAEAHAQAVTLFEQVLAIDSNYASVYEHLVDASLLSGDTARARWAAGRYLSLDSLADHADYVRWRLAAVVGSSVEREAIRSRITAMSFANAWRIAAITMLEGLDSRDASVAVTALGAHRASPSEQRTGSLTASALLANRGQHTAAAGSLGFVALPPGVPKEYENLLWSVSRAFEDESVSDQQAAGIDSWLASQPPEPAFRYRGACALAQWRLSQRDLAGAERALNSLRGIARDAVVREVAGLNPGREPLCISMVVAWLAVQRGQSDARRLVGYADSLAVASFRSEPGKAESTVTLARLWEAVGDEAAALRTIRRVPYHHPSAPFFPLAVIAREEGRLAALGGDREGAIRAYRRYLALRVEPDERLKPEVEQVRKELARLERESVGR